MFTETGLDSSENAAIQMLAGHYGHAMRLNLRKTGALDTIYAMPDKFPRIPLSKALDKKCGMWKQKGPPYESRCFPCRDSSMGWISLPTNGALINLEWLVNNYKTVSDLVYREWYYVQLSIAPNVLTAGRRSYVSLSSIFPFGTSRVFQKPSGSRAEDFVAHRGGVDIYTQERGSRPGIIMSWGELNPNSVVWLTAGDLRMTGLLGCLMSVRGMQPWFAKRLRHILGSAWHEMPSHFPECVVPYMYDEFGSPGIHRQLAEQRRVSSAAS